MNIVNTEIIFQNKKIIGENLLLLIKDRGYTKASFSKLVDISRPTLDELIAGKIDCSTKLATYIDKILRNQKICEIYELIDYKNKIKDIPNSEFMKDLPKNYTVKPLANEMFAILEDIVHLCELYYR